MFQWSIMDQNFSPSGMPFSLYLKAKSKIYSIVQINTLPTIATAISVVAAFSAGLIADKTGRFWLPSYVVTIPLLIGVSLLVAWDVGEAGRLAGFMLTGFVGGELYIAETGTKHAFCVFQITISIVLTWMTAVSPLTMGWATVIMANDAEERAVVTASMNAIGQAIAAGTQIVQFPASGAPNFHGGFISILATTLAQLVSITLILFLSTRDGKNVVGGSNGI